MPGACRWNARAGRGRSGGALPQPRFGAADQQRGVVRDLAPHVAERAAGNRARDAADGLLAQDDLVAGARSGNLEDAQATVGTAAVVEARDRLLARVAALGEGDVGLVEPGLGGQNGLVELLAPGRRARLDAERLELLRVGGVELLLAPGLPRLDAVVVVADPVA